MMRWTAAIKAGILRDITHGAMTEADALDLHGITHEELMEWRWAYLTHGIKGLQAKSVAKHLYGSGPER